MRLDIRRIQTLKKGTEEYGIRARVKVVKNKVAPPFRRAEFDVIFGEGISNLGCIVDLAEEVGIIKKKGSWFSYNDDNIAQGRDNAIIYLRINPDICQTIETQLREKLASGATVSANTVGVIEGEDDSDADA